jgi:predicted phosphodiesterase
MRWSGCWSGKSDAWQLVKGNHEDYILECAAANGRGTGPEYEVNQFAYWAYRQVADYVPILANMPDQFSVCAPDGTELRVMHGSMRDNRDGVYPQTTDTELREQIAPAPRIFVTGHTHRPLIREIDGTTVVNIGSVGAPFDGRSAVELRPFHLERRCRVACRDCAPALRLCARGARLCPFGLFGLGPGRWPS